MSLVQQQGWGSGCCQFYISAAINLYLCSHKQSHSNIYMYPNNQQKPQYPPFNNNFVPPPQSYVQQQPSFLLPPQNQNNRAVFSSMIQPPTNNHNTPKSAGLSKLQSMGRFIKQQPEPSIKVIEPTFQNPTNLNFRNQAADKPKMSSSVIFAKGSDEQLNRFPTFGGEGTGTSRLQALMNNKNRAPEVSKEMSQEASSEARKKEIESIKEEMNRLNKKMQTFSFKRPEQNSGQQKPYFQLATRKTNPTNQPNNIQPTTADNNMAFFKNYSGGSTTTNYSASSSSSNSSESYNQPQYLNPNPQQYAKPPIQIQHSLSANELSRPNFAKREQNPGGMFKKKSAYVGVGNQSAQNNQRNVALSPRAHLRLAEKSPETIKAPVVTEFKPAEVVTVASPKKGIKRFESTNAELENIPTFSSNSSASKDNVPREFKKSDFAIGKKMGKGQFGEVMLVQHKATGFLCGLKVMSKKQIRQQKYENQVARELAIQFYLSHRNVAPLYGYFSDEENVYLLVEFCTNGQLLQLLRKAHRMEEADCSPIIREICEGLDYIHKEQIIHRDIKPENILFNFNTVKICDFGWAVYSGNGMRKTVAGSPLYYSPEVVLQTKYDQKIDIWAIGMMTYECLLGKIPFRIYSELDLNRIVQDEIKFPEYIDVTDEAKDFILKICKKNPEERMEMREILRHPFITKYLKEKKVGNDVIEEFRKVLA